MSQPSSSSAAFDPSSAEAAPPEFTETLVRPTQSVNARIAAQLGVAERQVRAAVELLDAGSTVPFIARYRKEATDGLDDAQLRDLEEQLRYLRELDERRVAVGASIAGQGKLTATLAAALRDADTKARIEDIYLPYKTKRRTKAQIAREAGLEPLVGVLSDPAADPQALALDLAVGFLAARGPDAEPIEPSAALEGARAIVIETASEDADLVGGLRERLFGRGTLAATARAGADPEVLKKFSDYAEWSESLSKVPSHRVLALLRGEKDQALSVTVDAGEDADYLPAIANSVGLPLVADATAGTVARWRNDCVRWAWRTKLLVSLTLDVRMRLKAQAEADAVTVFATNLKDLLLAAPAGTRTTLGLDPGFRTGVKVAVVDATGKVLEHATIYPHQPHNKRNDSIAVLGALVAKHRVELIAIGNGTASRETEQLVAELLRAQSSSQSGSQAGSPASAAAGRGAAAVMVSEAGASVYSASALASAELPDLDVSIRGAVSIARRLQDPLAELVKIDPKSIGVGQYQHDVTESTLARALDAVVEDAVNAVGVDVNTASVALLARVSGIGGSLANSIVGHRDRVGRFSSRAELLKVPSLGPKAFEQCAGFLRVAGAANPLDNSAVHPEAYPVAEAIAARAGYALTEVIGNAPALAKVRPADVVAAQDGAVGLPTVVDILAELVKPGRDPRPEFKTATFAAGVEKVADVRPGMVLEGVVTNVAAFGAFVDVGVHQDGLVHISAMSHDFVSDPHTVVRSGQVVKVKVLEVDLDRQRIGLSLRLDDEPGRDGKPSRGAPGRSAGSGPRASGQKGSGQKSAGQKGSGQKSAGQPAAATGSLADALRRAGFGQ